MANKKVILNEIVDGVVGDNLYPKTTIDQVEGLGEALDAAGSVSTVSVNNGNPLSPDANKNINITIPEDLKDLNEDSDHRVVTDAEKSTWNGKQNALTFDNVPTANSNNPVKSGGVYQAIQSIDVSSQISGKADKSEMSVVAGTGADADKTTITLKNGTSATVLTQHQDISGKQDTISNVTVAVDANTGTPAGIVNFSNNTLAFNFQNLKGAKGDTGERGIQGVQGPRGAEGAAGITGDVSDLNIRQAVDATTTYTATDVAGAEALQYILTHDIEGGFYYVES